jgi:hypothetical protein
MKPLALRSAEGIRKPMSTSTSTTSPSTVGLTQTPGAISTKPLPPTTGQLPVDGVDQTSTSTVVAKQAGHDGVPAWATPGYFTSLANGGGGTDQKAAGLKGGGGLQVRLASMQTPSKSTPRTMTVDTATTGARRERGRGLLARALHDVGVMGGRPMTAQEIAEAPAALHLTRPSAVASILEQGLRPTTGLYKNLTTWFRDAVYMFGREPTAYQKFVNFSTAAGEATATIEVDLKKLDPQKLYKRVLDGAIIYVSDAPIPKEALRLREAGR